VAGTLERQATSQARRICSKRCLPTENTGFRLGLKDLTLTDVATGEERQFVFRDEGAVAQALVRLLDQSALHAVYGRRLTLIDAQTLKMHYPPLVNGWTADNDLCTFSSDFRWMMYYALGGTESRAKVCIWHPLPCRGEAVGLVGGRETCRQGSRAIGWSLKVLGLPQMTDTPAKPPPGRWSFSLRTLFVVVDGCSAAGWGGN